MIVPREQVAGLILVGGQSERMGCDKATVILGDHPLWRIAVRNLEPLVDTILLVGEISEPFETEPYSLIPDDPAGLGPMGGIVTGLELSGYEHHLVLAVDYPLVQRKFLELLLTKSHGYEAVCGRSSEFLEPLIGYFNLSCAPAIRDMIAAGEIRTHKLFDKVRSYIVSDEAYDQVDPERRSQINVNTPAELARAREFLGAGDR